MTPVGNVTPVVVVTAADVPIVVPLVVFCDPLQLGKQSSLVAWRSSRYVSAMFMSSSMASSCVKMFGLLTSSKYPSYLVWFDTH